MCYNREAMFICGCPKIQELRSSAIDIIEESTITDADLKIVAIKFLMLQSLNFILENDSELCDKVCGQNMCIFCGRVFRTVNDKQLLLSELSTMELSKLVQKTRKLFLLSKPNTETYEEGAYGFASVTATSEMNNEEGILNAPSSKLNFDISSDSNSSIDTIPWCTEIKSRRSSTTSTSSKARSLSAESKNLVEAHSTPVRRINSSRKSFRRSSSTSSSARTYSIQSEDSPNCTPVPKIDVRGRNQDNVQRAQSSGLNMNFNEPTTSSNTSRLRSVSKKSKDSYKPKPLMCKTYSEECLTMSIRASNYNSQHSTSRIFKETISSLCKKSNASKSLEVSNTAARSSQPSIANSRIMRETVSSLAKRHVLSDDVKAKRIAKLKSRKINEIQAETKTKKADLSKQISNSVSLDSSSFEESANTFRSRSNTFTISKGCNRCCRAQSGGSDSGVDYIGRSSGELNSASTSESSPTGSLSGIETIASSSDSDFEDQRSFDEYIKEQALKSKQRNEESIRDMKQIRMKIKEVRDVVSAALASAIPKK